VPKHLALLLDVQRLHAAYVVPPKPQRDAPEEADDTAVEAPEAG
jgi:hypothetical protein